MTGTISQSIEPVQISIGGVAVALRTGDPAFRSMVAQRYSTFVEQPSITEFNFDIEVLEPSDENAEDDVQVQLDGDSWLMKRGDFEARWSTSSRHGNVRQARNPYAIDSVLRIVHSLALAQRGGFLLHAASVIRNGKAFLFAGISGAGKTTISRLAPVDCTLLTDEVSYVRPDAATYFAYGTPFAGELGKPGENCFAPIDTLFLLEKAATNRIEEVAQTDAMRVVLRNILFFAADPTLVHLVFQAAYNFVQRVPIKKLRFKPDESVWDLIR